MEIRLADLNDRRAVWLWTHDEYFSILSKKKIL